MENEALESLCPSIENIQKPPQKQTKGESSDEESYEHKVTMFRMFKDQ